MLLENNSRDKLCYKCHVRVELIFLEEILKACFILTLKVDTFYERNVYQMLLVMHKAVLLLFGKFVSSSSINLDWWSNCRDWSAGLWLKNFIIQSIYSTNWFRNLFEHLCSYHLIGILMAGKVSKQVRWVNSERHYCVNAYKSIRWTWEKGPENKF